MNGQLSEHPLAEIISETLNQSLTGALRLMRDRARAVIYFERGELQYATANLRPFRLSECLRRWKIIPEERIAPLSALSDLELGARLVSDGLLTSEQLASLRARQVLESLPPLLLWTDGAWEFDPGIGVAEALRVSVTVRPLLAESARRLPYAVIAARLADADEMLSPRRDASALDFDLKPSEAFLLSRFDSPLTVAELLAVSGLGEVETRRATYVLIVAGLVQRSASHRVLNLERCKRTTVRQRPAISRSASDKLAERDEQAEMMELFARAEAEDFYKTLGVNQRATPQEIKRAYYALAKRFHPDRFRRDLDQATRARIESAFARIAQAYETLKEEATRTAYDLNLSNRVFTSTSTTRQTAEDSTQRAAEAYRRGEEALRAGETQRAAKEFGEAARLMPQEARYRAALGCALMRDRTTRRQAEAELQAAIALDARNADYRVRLAELYRSVGLLQRARRELEQALALDGQHDEARCLLRELRRLTGTPS
ncbi:MAG: hypothetical protein C4334_01430 [Pyrinomonas sp.]|uniref:DnaJ domain-containing protein n=1 Tax=Pyrinomonas sp. TaxID=2080306 RepID=UPI003329A063